ncbi:DEKNAAC103562 [Brettanomyces naardenensis]|uniref:Large ribosomal subunit protein uL3m n=1 Tax=Brettanomyces naardenensis TaxID=13370 RepID=A0A448YN23_BRENA|nr:DEKNAAC103562 [Brettanomyces naardenensis]
MSSRTLLPIICRRFNSSLRVSGFSKGQLVSPGAVPYVETKDTLKQKSAEARRLRKRLLERPGIIGIKRGMTCFYDNQGHRFPATVVEIDQCEVLYNKTLEKHGYYAVQVGAGHRKPENETKPMLGHFRNAKVSPKANICEFEVRDKTGLVAPGTELKADRFKVGQMVDVISHSKGKGFAGVMKRWGFHGGPATHGASLSHRLAGSTGQNTTPARVFPGKKMAGHMGNREHTLFNLEVLDANGEKGYLLLKGSVSGSNGSYLKIRDGLKGNGRHIIAIPSGSE